MEFRVAFEFRREFFDEVQGGIGPSSCNKLPVGLLECLGFVDGRDEINNVPFVNPWTPVTTPHRVVVMKQFFQVCWNSQFKQEFVKRALIQYELRCEQIIQRETGNREYLIECSFQSPEFKRVPGVGSCEPRFNDGRQA